jgi:Fe-S-cluster containining protein
MNRHLLPKNVTRIDKEERFCFACHPAISCFTDCCRQLELALTPYDVLRLKKGCGLSSDEFLDRYAIMEQEKFEAFPRFYLTMVDDGLASCVFVSKSGCTVYADRPGACRAYPLGRAAIRQSDEIMEEFFVILKEGHCHGFAEKREQSGADYSAEQGLTTYNRFNDAVAAILQHEQIRQGRQFSDNEIQEFILALYNLDLFRKRLLAGELPDSESLDNTGKNLLANDEKLLIYGINWLKKRLFGNYA